MTQCEQVLDYIKRFGSITPIEALADLGIMRLGARCWDLRKEGHDIITETETSVNRFGKPVSYARYKLHTGVSSPESTPYSPESTLDMTQEEEEQLAAWDKQDAEDMYNYTNNQGELL